VIILHEEELSASVNGSPPAKTDLKLKSLLDSTDFNKIRINSPSPDIKIEALDVRPPAIQLVLQGGPMGRVEQWVFLGDNVDFGPAALRFLPGMPPEPTPMKMVPRLERHFVFAKQDFPISKAIHGETTGAD